MGTRPAQLHRPISSMVTGNITQTAGAVLTCSPGQTANVCVTSKRLKLFGEDI